MTTSPAEEALADRLAAWRADGAWRIDPVRFRYLEALARRTARQAEPLRSVARDKLAAAIRQFDDRLQATPPAAALPAARARAAACPPLAELNAYLREATASRAQEDTAGQPAPRDELASVRAFRKAWSRGRSQEQVAQALARKPANAGPLNSHALVLQVLEAMRALSPDYLRRFLVQVETLQWLEQAVQGLPAKPGKGARDGKAPARKGRAKKG